MHVSPQHMRTMPKGRMLFGDGSTTIGVGISDLFGPSLLSLLVTAGADYVLVDMEHTSFSYRDAGALIASARGVDLPVIVRPPEVTRSAIGRLLDLGADGVLVQRIGGAEEAAAAVRFAKYRPLGERGDDGRIAAAAELEDPRALIDAVNRNTTVLAIVETTDGVENIDPICSTPGIDAVWIGPADLSLALDVPGATDGAVYKDAERRILESCRAHGMPFAIGSASTPEQAAEQIRLGCFTVLTDDERTLLARAIADYVGQVRETAAGARKEAPAG
jgi:2-keto-3-deoxy-L-rhamnonate aldolase RhmA